MRIAVTGPIELGPLAPHLDAWDDLAEGYSFPYVTTLTSGLLARGHEVEVFALNESITVPRTYTGEQLTVHVLPARPNGRAQVKDAYRAERHELSEAIGSSRCDVVHGHWTYEFGAAAVQSGKPNVVTAHDHPWMIVKAASQLSSSRSGSHRTVAVLRNGRRATLRAFVAEAVVRRADIVTAVAPSVKQHLERWMFPRGSVRVIPNGLPPAERRARSAPRNPDEPVYALIANGFDNGKNTGTAIEALKLVRRSIPAARLVLIGRDHDENGVARVWAREHGFDQGCDWRGQLTHAQVNEILLNEADILVHPSLNEACSMAIMEAQAAGLPVIGGKNSGGVPFSLQGGSAGELIDITRADEVANAMVNLARDAAAYSRFSSGGIAALTTPFNLDLVLDAYEALYAQAASRR